MIGDDIAWMRFGEDGRLYAVNPECGLFGVAPGTGVDTNPNAMRTIEQGNSIFTNVARTDDGDVWWEGMTEEPPAHLTDWKGSDWTPDSEREGRPPEHPLLHPGQAVPDPGAGVRRPERRADRRDPLRRPPQDDRPARLPVARLEPRHLRRRDPLLARPPPPPTGAVGVVRRDPMAMLPFIGYNAGDYVQHWINIGKSADAEQAAEDLLRQLVPPGRRRQVPVAGLRREQPRAQVGRRAPRGQGRRRRDPDRPRARSPRASTSTAST